MYDNIVFYEEGRFFIRCFFATHLQADKKITELHKVWIKEK